MFRFSVMTILALALSACAASAQHTENPSTSTPWSEPDHEVPMAQPRLAKPQVSVANVASPTSTEIGQSRDQSTVAAKAAVESIYFPIDATEVDDSSMRLLLANAARLKEHPRWIVTLVAHTQQLGSSSYDLAVAEEEINTVTRLLRAFGVPNSQIRHRSGERGKTFATCAATACRTGVGHVDLIYE